MTIPPSAQSIQAAFPGMSDMEASFADVVLWYSGFDDPQKLRVLRYSPDDLAVVIWKRNEARSEKDYRTSDFLRDVLNRAGIDTRDRSV